jgi:hypothetical protein
VRPQIPQESPHVVLIVAVDQREADGEIVHRIGGQQERVAAQVQFVDTQGPGEMPQRPLAVLGHVQPRHFAVRTVVNKAFREVQQKVPGQRRPHGLYAHAVVQQTIQHGFADFVVVVAFGIDALGRRAKGLAAVAPCAILCVLDFQMHDLLVGDRADRSDQRLPCLATSWLAAGGARVSRRATTHLHKTRRDLRGFHACVLRWEWVI